MNILDAIFSIFFAMFYTLIWLALRGIMSRIIMGPIKKEKQQDLKKYYAQYFTEDEAENYQTSIAWRVMCIIYLVRMFIRPTTTSIIIRIIFVLLILVICYNLWKVTVRTKDKLKQKVGAADDAEFQKIFKLFKAVGAPGGALEVFVVVIMLFAAIIGAIFSVIEKFLSSDSKSDPEKEYMRDLEDWHYKQVQQQQKEEERSEYERQRDEERLRRSNW